MPENGVVLPLCLKNSLFVMFAFSVFYNDRFGLKIILVVDI
jgi:hypothetical protein